MPSLSLSRQHFFVLVAVLFVVLPLIGVLVFQPALDQLWCKHVTLPDYEARLGFHFGRVQARQPSGAAGEAWVFTAINPNSVLARAGVKPGDAPQMYHGFCELCGELGAILRGEQAEFRVTNVYGAGGAPTRTVTVARR